MSNESCYLARKLLSPGSGIPFPSSKAVRRRPDRSNPPPRSRASSLAHVERHLSTHHQINPQDRVSASTIHYLIQMFFPRQQKMANPPEEEKKHSQNRPKRRRRRWRPATTDWKLSSFNMTSLSIAAIALGALSMQVKGQKNSREIISRAGINGKISLRIL